jgi:LPXTG-site transpeptidase (sortase) family protein
MLTGLHPSPVRTTDPGSTNGGRSLGSRWCEQDLVTAHHGITSKGAQTTVMHRIAAESAKSMLLIGVTLIFVSLSLAAFQPAQDAGTQPLCEVTATALVEGQSLFAEVTSLPATVLPQQGGAPQVLLTAQTHGSSVEPASLASDANAMPTARPAATAAAPRTMPLLGPGSEYERHEGAKPTPNEAVMGPQAPSQPRPTATPSPTPYSPQPPTRIVAPAIDLDARVVPVTWKLVKRGGTQATAWQVPKNNAGWHATSALPGEVGNTVLSGHRNIYAEVFRYLPDLETGDEISLYAGDRVYVYTVAEKHIVQEVGVSERVRLENGAWIGRTDDVRLTLITCAPYEAPGNTHRVIIVARP